MLFKVNQGLTYVDEPYLKENSFLGKSLDTEEPPLYENVKNELPEPVFDGHDSVISCYNKAWEIAFSNLRKPEKESGLVSNFIDTAFNGFTFMWDSAFMMMFGKYANSIFNFQKTLDNFYAKQHRDGFICREICEAEDGEHFAPHDPSSTGPNILAWCEWEYFKLTNDKVRLSKVFAPLMAFQKWFKLNRTWQSGLYFTSGWGCGMDNLPRHDESFPDFTHGHMDWVDATIQSALNAKILVNMATVLNRENEVSEIKEEAEFLEKQINDLLWDEKTAFYYDRFKDGRLSMVKTIGSYWALLADVVPAQRIQRFVAHLDNENEFKRPHRVPALSFDHPDYNENGRYWCGGVWAPTNYMILKGLEKTGFNKLAYEIAVNHLENVTKVYEKTGTLWENYAPESYKKGEPSRKNFVGWTGLVPISVLFEYVFGIRPDADRKTIIWYVNRTEKHGILKYPFMNEKFDLICEARAENEKPKITVKGNIPVTVEVHWNDTVETISFMND